MEGDSTNKIRFAVRILIAGLAFFSMVSGEMKSESIGPYIISFDIGVAEDYTIRNFTKEDNTEMTKEFEEFDIYALAINNSQNFALISVANFKNKMDNSMYQCQKYIEDYLNRLGYEPDPNPTKISIDGNNENGIMYVGNNFTSKHSIYAIEYWKYLNTIDVFIISDFSLENETASLVKSIKIRE